MERKNSSSRIYVGNLPWGTTSRDIQTIFESIGRVRAVSHVFGCRYAFVDLEDSKKALDAVTMDGYFFKGNYLKVEFARGRKFRRGNCNRQKSQIPHFCREKYCVLVTGLPVKCSWQDLKDHMRGAGEVVFANAYKDGSGVVEFKRKRDMRDAAKRLNLSKFTTYQGDKAYIRVFRAVESSRGGPSRERTRSRSRSGSVSRRRGVRTRSGSVSRDLWSPSPAPYRRGPPRSPTYAFYRSG